MVSQKWIWKDDGDGDGDAGALQIVTGEEGGGWVGG